MEGYSQSGCREHRQVVCAVAYCYSLGYINLLYLCQQSEQFGLAFSVNYLAKVSSGEFSVFYFKFICVNIVYSEFAFQMLAEVSKSSGKYRYLVSVVFQYKHQSFHSFRDRQIFGYFLHYTFVQAFQQCNPLGETFLEVYFSTHRAFGYGFDLFAHSGTFRQFVYTFCLYQRRVHIETNQSSHTAVHVVKL